MSFLNKLEKVVKVVLLRPPAAMKVVSRKQHRVLKEKLNGHAVDTLVGLHDAGYEAYLVGGCVRDIQLGKMPKDFDVVTNATPEEVAATFRNSRIIGRRFRLAHVFYRGEIIEVSTFRANTQDFDQGDAEMGDGALARKANNTYGTLEEDAWRRDFTINALYYRLEDSSILDYTGGMKDIKHRRLRMIGDPRQRFHEDPVRLLRAIRLAAKLNLKIEKTMYNELIAHPHLLQHVAPARLFDEVGKLFFTGHAVSSYRWLQSTGYFEALFPDTYDVLEEISDVRYRKLLDLVMSETDRRYGKDLSLSPGYLLAVMFWPVVAQTQAEIFKQTGRYGLSVHQAIRQSLTAARTMLQIPKRFTGMMQAIWSLFYRLQVPPTNQIRVERILAQRYVRAGVDFLELQTAAGWDFAESIEWWRKRLPKQRPHSRSRDMRRRGNRRRLPRQKRS